MFAGVPRQSPLRTAVIRRCRHGLSPDGRRRLLFSAIRAVEDHPQRQVLRKKLETVHDTRGREQEIARPERHALVADDIRSRASDYDINLVTPVRLLRVDVLGLVELDFELAAFEQDSVSRSAKGVIRGMHVRSGAGEAKLVRCSSGAVLDVVVDLRPDSPTYRNTEYFDLTGENQVSVYVPAGCAHGFQALTDPADVSYRIDRAHDPSEDVSIRFDDPDLDIPWPLPVTLMSERDKAAPSLALATARLT